MGRKPMIGQSSKRVQRAIMVSTLIWLISFPRRGQWQKKLTTKNKLGPHSMSYWDQWHKMVLSIWVTSRKNGKAWKCWLTRNGWCIFWKQRAPNLLVRLRNTCTRFARTSVRPSSTVLSWSQSDFPPPSFSNFLHFVGEKEYIKGMILNPGSRWDFFKGKICILQKNIYIPTLIFFQLIRPNSIWISMLPLLSIQFLFHIRIDPIENRDSKNYLKVIMSKLKDYDEESNQQISS